MTTIVEWLKCKAHRAINISLLQFTVLMMMENLVEKLLLLRVSQQCPAECDSSIFLLFNFPNYFFISNIEVKKLWKRVWQRQVAHTEKKNLGRTLHIFCAKIFFFCSFAKNRSYFSDLWLWRVRWRSYFGEFSLSEDWALVIHIIL